MFSFVIQHFLLLHLPTRSSQRPAWTSLLLSACREVREEKLFRQFDLANPAELRQCQDWWAGLVDEAEAGVGAWLLLSWLVKLLDRDWAGWEGAGRKGGPPLIYHLCPASGPAIHLYSALLQQDKIGLPTARHLLQLAAHQAEWEDSQVPNIKKPVK